LAKWLGHDEAIHVIPFGVDDAFFDTPDEDPADTRRRWKIPPDAFVVLHVGSVGPRKNLPVVIAAVDALRRSGVDAWLLQVGGTLTSKQEADLQQRGLARHVARVGEVEEPELRKAYRASDVLLFPSHYEGFGFPVLEAMASGLPVVTSGAGGLAEVAGDAAVVVGGRELEPYIGALKRLERTDHWREKLKCKGLERARRYRWVETARKTAEVYRQLV
jgi:glycosyltransferase involved in cell wall biosynthesis